MTVFKDGQDFYGYYVPKTFKNLSAAEKVTKMDSVIAIADDFLGLSTATLSYNPAAQIWYSVDLNGNGKVDPAEITSMRCDGLVEYAYEYNGFSVYGGNISIFDTEIRNNHIAPNVTPKQQIKHYLQNCLGDIDGDGNVSSADSRLVSRYAVDLEEFDAYQQWNADVDGDNDVDSEDARLVMRYASGLETGFEADPFPSE